MKADDDAPGAGMGAPAQFSMQGSKETEGERRDAQCIARLQDQQAEYIELTVIVSILYGATLTGNCRAIEKALGVHHA